MKKNNLIVICLDTFRTDIVGDNQAWSFIRTPNIDRLARESVVFTRCYAEGLATLPVRRCWFTGHASFPWRFDTPSEGMSMKTGWGWHPIPHEHDTMAERLHDEGFLTGLVADTFHMFKPTCNYTRGFLSWQFIRGHENDMLRTGPLDRVDLAAFVPEDQATPARHPTLLQYLLNALDRSYEEDFYAAKVFRTAAKFLEDNRANQPFFLWIDSFSPHEVWDPPRYYADSYFHAPGVKDYILPQVVNGMPDRTEADIERTKALYYGFCTFVDRWIGHLFQTMEAMGLWDNTIVAFVSDHGTELMDRGKFSKAADRLFPFTTRQNWFIRHPDGPRGVSCDAWVEDTDFFPTMMSLLGVEPRVDDGFDVWPLAVENAPPVRDYVITGCRSFVCVRDDRSAVHLDCSKPRDEAIFEVYDFTTDPDETRNVKGEHPDIERSALDRLEEVAGALPVQFHEYQSRCNALGRYNARIMNSFAPVRWPDE